MSVIFRFLIGLTVLTFPSAPAWAKSRAILFGGYDRPTGAISPEINDFANNLSTIGRALWARGFEIEILFEENSGSLTDQSYKRARGFDGGSRESITQALEQTPPSYWGYATERNLRSRLQEAASELEDGDQLLVAITAHGELVAPGQLGIRIARDRLLDLRLFAREFAKLKTHGIRLGFFLTPCYAGTILPFLSAYGCAMSLSPATNASYSDSLTGELFSGDTYSFLDLYLRFLNVTRTDDFPTLSSLPVDAANAFSHLNDSEESELPLEELNVFTTAHRIDTRTSSPGRPHRYRELYLEWMKPRAQAIRSTPVGFDCTQFRF